MKKRAAAEAVAAPASSAAEAGDDHTAAAKRIKEAAESSPPPAPDFLNEYDGHTLSGSSGVIDSIDRVNIQDLTPESFYRDYVAKRRPCVISGCFPDSQWKVSTKWVSSSYLKEKAGDVEISAEKRIDTKAKFGRGNEVKLQFGRFLDLLDGGSDAYYLTTQDVLTTADGRPHVMSPFMEKLTDDFPLRPKLIGNLIPQNINVWMGRSKGGSSSGLHHDYHDNLYCVVSGRKKFDLFSPCDAVNLYTRGRLRRIHKNGRINYVGEETNADGSHAQAEMALDASICQEDAVKELEAAEAAVERGEEDAEERLERAEKALDEAMEAVMDAEEDSDDEGGTGRLFGAVAGKDGDNDGNEDDDGSDICDSDEEDADFWKAAERKKLELQGKVEVPRPRNLLEVASDSPKKTRYNKTNDNGDDDDNYIGFEVEGRVVDQTVKDPLNFSLVDTTLNETDLKVRYPKFASAKKATVEISRGNMLYLPASWFHEVTSYGGEEEGHCAFNYWLHPPDGESFEKPYASSFWPKDWDLRKLPV